VGEPNAHGKHGSKLVVEFSSHVDAVEMKKDQSVRFVEWFLAHLGQILSD
jgi:hypothetical protein